MDGEAGVRRVLDIMQDETENALGLLGYTNVAEVERSCVVLPHARWRTQVREVVAAADRTGPPVNRSVG